jgi:hypothetical protein
MAGVTSMQGMIRGGPATVRGAGEGAAAGKGPGGGRALKCRSRDGSRAGLDALPIPKAGGRCRGRDSGHGALLARRRSSA